MRGCDKVRVPVITLVCCGSLSALLVCLHTHEAHTPASPPHQRVVAHGRTVQEWCARYAAAETTESHKRVGDVRRRGKAQKGIGQRRNVCVRTSTRARAHTHTHTLSPPACAHTYAHAHTCAHMHAACRMSECLYAHTNTNEHTHARAYTSWCTRSKRATHTLD